MSELDDLTLREAFSQFHTDALTAVPPQDITGVRTIARRRRATRAGVIGAMAALVLAVPVAAYALVGRSDSGPPAVRPSLSTSPSASASPSVSPSASTAPPAPDGKISLDELGDATLDIPAWPAGGMQCPTQRQKFTNGDTGPSDGSAPATKIEKVAYADVDHDGAQETIALLYCYLQGGDNQVVVFDRDAAGHIVTFGQVVTQDKSVKQMFDVRGGADGSVEVQVGDLSICCGTTPDMAEHQWRTYAWNGARFTQTDGPMAFHPAPQPNDVSVTSPTTHLVLGPVEGGVRKATFTMTVTDKGPARSPGLRLSIFAYLTADPTAIGGQQKSLPAPVRLSTDAPGCEKTTTTVLPFLRLECHLPALAAGASRTYTFTLVSPPANDGVLHTQADLLHRSEPYMDAELFEEQPGIRLIRNDPDTSDNVVGFPMTRAG